MAGMAGGRVGVLAVWCAALVALAVAHDGSVMFRVRAMNDAARMFATASCVDMYRSGDLFEVRRHPAAPPPGR